MRASRPLLRRPLTWAALLTLPAVVALLLPVPGSAQTSNRPLRWEGTAGAASVLVDINTEPSLIPLSQFIHFEAPFADTQWSSLGVAEARAATFYPGTSGTQGPALMCEFGFPCAQIPGFPPTYPLLAEDNQADGRPAQTDSGLARAEVTADFVRGRSELQQGSGVEPIFAPLQAAFTVDSATADSFEEFADGALVTRGVAVVNGLNVGGGAFTVDSIRVESLSRADGEAVTGGSKVTIQGAAVAGTPVVVGSDGVRVADQGGGGQQNDEANRALNEQLQQAGIRVRTIGGDHTNEGHRSQGSATGLRMEIQFDVADPTGGQLPQPPQAPLPPQLPQPGPGTAFRTYLGTFTFGVAASSAFATNAGFAPGSGDLGDLFPGPAGGGPTDDPTGGGDLSTPVPPDLGSSPPLAEPRGGDQPPAVAGPQDGGTPAPSDEFEFGVLGGELLTQRITGAYLVTGALTLIFLLVSRLAPWLIRRGGAASDRGTEGS